MGTVGTTTAGTPLQLPANTLIDRDPLTGYLYALHRSSTADTFEFRRSVDGGANWTLHTSRLRTAVQEMGSIFIPNDGHLYWTYRTNESSQDRIYVRRLRLADAVWGAEILTGTPGNGGVAGAVHTGMDLQVVGGAGARYNGQLGAWVAVAVGTILAGVRGITLYGVFYPLTGQEGFSNTSVYVGNRQWLVESGTGQVTPSVDIEHDGTGKVSAVPNLWVTWGRAKVHLVKLAWNGKWNGTSSWLDLSTTLSPLQDGVAGRWDGDRFVIAVPDPSTTDRVKIFERNRANSITTQRQSPAHPTGVVRTCSFSYNAINKDLRVFATGTSTPDLYYVDYIRASATWGSWTLVTSTDVMGTPPTQFSVRRGSTGNAKYDFIIAHPGTPNTVASFHQSLAYPPNPPVWDYAAIGYTTGAAADVNQPLPLDWTFSDPDPADTQSAYALSRQIGTGSLQYWRASDSTWQATEQKNITSASVVTLATGWASGSDAQYSFRVKTWDSADVASSYGDSLVLVPSVRIDPLLSAPTQHQVLTVGSVTATWTVAEQKAYRIYLVPAAAQLLTNPYFETNVNGWDLLTATSLTRSTAQFHEGAASARLVPDGTSSTPRAETTTQHPVLPGRDYSASTWLRPDTANKTSRVYFSWFDGDGVFLTTTGQLRSPQAGTWQYNQCTAKPVAGAEIVRLGVSELNTPAAGDAWYFDEALLIDMGQAVYDSGWRISTDLTFTPPYALLDNTGWYVGVQTQNLEGLASAINWMHFTVDFVEPATPTVALAPISAQGIIRVTITNPTPGGGQPALADQDLWRRPVGDSSDGVRVATALSSGATVDDFGPASGVNYEYRVLARGTNGASIFGAWTA